MNNFKGKIKKLKRYNEITKELQQMIDNFDAFKQKIYDPAIQTLSDMPLSKIYNKDKLEKNLFYMMELEKKLFEHLEILKNEKENIENAINLIENANARIIMRYRYIDSIKFEQICNLTNYSWRQVHRYHSDALKKIII